MSKTFLVSFGLWMAASPLVANTVILQDDFNDGVIDPAWTVNAYEASDPQASVTYTAEETGSVLRMTELNDPIASGSGGSWAYVEYSRTFGAAYSTFDLSFDLGWDQDTTDMMGITVRMINSAGETFSTAGFIDSWVGSTGGLGARIGETSTGFAADTTAPSGTASFQITKTGDNISILLDDSPYFSGTVSGESLKTVTLQFQSYNFEGTPSNSTFGTLDVDQVIVAVPEPGTLLLASITFLSSLGLLCRLRRR